ncbi:leucine zipper domain-containing protein [Mycobacterium colombiense]|uniref:leucine zipper domain-containing protein n=1 Tax=Mycobacterium colombiense TaxID=339268 RepID=UPI0009BCE7CE|nr:leucine zipper domain-containing protein [Mycobacterium colombiense]
MSQVAEKGGESPQTPHSWLARYDAEALDGLVDRPRKRRGHPTIGAHCWRPQIAPPKSRIRQNLRPTRTE